MMSHQPIRKLNKKVIYCCLIGLVALSVPAIFSLASSAKNDRNADSQRREPQANLNVHDTKSISGTEQFPETYSDVTKFEKDLAQQKNKEEELIDALAEFDSKDSFQEKKPQTYSAGGHYGRDDDPWQEAMKREHKQRAFDRYDAKRSDIMFINNMRNKGRDKIEDAREEEILAMIDKAMPSEEKLGSNPGDMLLVKNDDTKDPHKRFLGDKRGVGGVKQSLPYMVSEGTLIHAVLLSEINTDLPGPILARVSHNIWDSKTGQTLLIPQNSKLIGEYNAAVGQGQKRAQIVWTRIIYPNQQSVDLGRMVGVDKKGTSGSVGTVDNHYDKVALALLLTTSLGAGVRMTQGKYDPNTASMGEEFGNSLAQETTRIGSRITDKMLSIKPTITVPMGERLNVFVEQDLHLQPYSG